ncbi:amino acid permease [Methanosalsum zhilinae]|uniref:amino acid permease n=1 Tax=Methanosalsum zhilinae TaxID=39669 RepID=UPI0006932428|nr:amino acid permease [Methanosalsum zhilinae]
MLDTSKFDPFMPYGYSSILATTGLIFISYLGITQLAAISEEVKDPSKNLPRAFIASVASVTLLYTGVMIVINGMLPLEKAIVTSTPLVDVADLMAGSSGQIIIVFAGLLATISTANAAILASSRFPFAMGRDDLMPKWFVEIHSKYDTPYKAILVTGFVMLLLLLLFNVEQLAKLGSTFNILIFVLINLSAVILRRSSMEWYKPTFKDPFYPLTQIIGILGSLILLPLIGLMPLAFALAVIAAGIAWYMVYGKEKAIPKYNVLDLIENTVVPVETTYEKIKVLVPLANPEHEKDLLKLADKLGDEIVGLHVIRVPGQTSLLAAQEAYHENKLQINSELERKFRECIRLPEHKHEYIVAFDHSVSNSIMEQSEIEKVTLIVMGWHEVDRFHPSAGNVANKVLTSAKKHIVILKGYMPPEIKTILVAFNAKDNSKYCLYLAKRLAMTTGAQIKLLRIINPDLSAEEKQEKIKEAKEAALDEEGFNVVYEIQEKYSTEDAILEAANEHDIIMIGDSSQRFKRAFLGTLPQRIARHTRKPVIIVKRYKPLSKEGISSIFVKINSVKNRFLRKLKLKN